jgi:rhodanese-related sulfurtransferase
MDMNMIPEITVEDLAGKLRSPDHFILLGVREEWELALARIVDPRLEVRPMSRLASEGTAALPQAALQKDAEIIVVCHQGVRSADVTGWLASQGWSRVFSVEGGIDEYARRIDPSVGFY